MELQKKIELLNNFNEKEICSIVGEIFNMRGLSNLIVVDNQTLIGELQTLLGATRKILIFIYTSKLSAVSEFDIKKIQETLAEIQEKYNPSETYLISKTPISNKVDKSLKQFMSHIQLIDRDSLIKFIDETDENIWRKGSPELINYENYIKERNLQIGIDLKSLPFYTDKYKKLLDVYIEPSLYHYYEDPKTRTLIRERGSIESCINEKRPIVISGQAGTGKSTLLKKIGEQILQKDNKQGEKKDIPVYITIGNIIDSNYANIDDLILSEISKFIPFSTFEDLINEYQITIIIDSLDELDKNKQEKIITELDHLYTNNNIKFIIASRDQENLLTNSKNKDIQKYTIQNFNLTQIQKFIASFFLGENLKAESLIEALKENRILDRLPLNPLTLSLVSILYEENNFEIPATITDIYNNFNSLVLGRFTVQSRAEFIDISFKERILSIYALALMETQEHRPFLLSEFNSFFKEYYKNKTLPIKEEKLQEVLAFIINHTGVLIINENNRVQFTHDSYMEYYAALEIFKHQRNKDKDLIENFFDPNWQNAAIFFAGMSKDMPSFLNEILIKISKARILPEYYSSVYGSGYLLQALYQTDNRLRADVILQALNNNIKALESIRLLAEDDMFLFKNYSLPILSTMNLMFFYESFNSATLKSPLEIAFNSVLQQYNIQESVTDGFKLINLGLILDSRRLSSPQYMESIIENKSIMSTPELYATLDVTLTTWGETYVELKKELQKNYRNRINSPVKHLLQTPAKKLKFSNLSSIGKEKCVKLIVEGETDAIILEYAFRVLTGGENPYWQIEHAGNLNNAGVKELSKCLCSINPVISHDQIIIGIFDHDSGGIQEYGSLKKEIFEEKEPYGVKKHKEKPIYGILLPIPGEVGYYKKEQQNLNFFEIEHYFGHEFLRKHDMLKDSGIDGIYRVVDKQKKRFSQIIKKENDPQIFKFFKDIFDKIDEISNTKINYIV